MVMAHCQGTRSHIAPYRSFISISRVQIYSFVLLILLLHIVNPTISSGGANLSDHLALMAIKSHITHDPQGTLGTWNTSLHFCQWEGVTCGRRHRRVTVLDLSSLSLVGSLSPHVGNLSFLRSLWLFNNSFSGGIPHEIGRLFRLRVLYLTDNSFEGEIPRSLSNCTHMKKLWLDGNKVEGKLPDELTSLVKLNDLILMKNNITGGVPFNIGNLTSLQQFFASENPIGGSIPHSLGNLRNLDSLVLSDVQLSGTIPPAFYNLSSLVTLDLSKNQISGELPQDIGLKLPYLQYFLIWTNQFIGYIPPSLSNCSNLIWCDLSDNRFGWKIGFSFENMPNLERIILYGIINRGDELNVINLIDSLVNCSKLQWLDLGDAQIRGVLPNSIGNLSTQLLQLSLGENFIYGRIPSTIGNLVSLELLELHKNQLTGPIPSTIGNLEKVQQLYLESNILADKIPDSLGNLSLVLEINLANNRLEETIPLDIVHCQRLVSLSLSTNNLIGLIPRKLFELSSLSILLDLSENQLVGPLPQEIGNLKNLMELDVSNNHLLGEIPNSISSCLSLQYVYLQGNKFQGSLPPSFRFLRGIQWLDLSVNNFSGQIPRFLENHSLSYLNLSFNNFEGEVPMEGVFKNSSVVAIVGNNMLCGGMSELGLPKCPLVNSKKGKGLSVAIVVVISLCSLLGCVAFTSSLLFCWWRRKKPTRQAEAPTMQSLPRVSYGSLFKATDGFSERNLLGTGSFSSVYKAMLEPDGKMVAVKVLQLQNHGALKSFVAECEALKNIRHRNLLNIITSCSSIDFQGNDFKALVYEFMPNGNLERWLHPSPENLISNEETPHRLSLHQRVTIAIDVAHAIHYLHQDCEVSIIHCDLKPNNILLDNDMVAHIGDFGLAKFLPLKPCQSSSLGIRGTIGYAAPEYGVGSEMTKEGDIYSFGILLLEMMTGKRPTHPIFQEGLNLHEYVKIALPDRMMEIIETSLFRMPQEEMEREKMNHGYTMDEGRKWERVEEGLISLARIGLACSMEAPKERMDTSKVIHELHRIKGLLVGM